MAKLDQATIKLNETLLRYVKGMVSAWEEWLKAQKN